MSKYLSSYFLPLILTLAIPWQVQAYDLLKKVPEDIKYEVNIEKNKFQKDLLCLLRKHHRPDEFYNRMREGQAYIDSIKDIIRDNQSIKASDWMSHEAYVEDNILMRHFKKIRDRTKAEVKAYTFNSVFWFHFAHSVPLIDRVNMKKSNAMKLEQSLNLANQLLAPYPIPEYRDPTTNEVLMPARTSYEATHNLSKDPSPLRSLKFAEYGSLSKRMDSEEIGEYGKTLWQHSEFADPFVEELINKDFQSMDQFQLIEKLLPHYNYDVLTTLGVIGYSFERERKGACLYHRKALCYFGSRMKPLLQSSDPNILAEVKMRESQPAHEREYESFEERFKERFDDPIGYNYHFWGFLNAGIQGNSFLDIGSYINEIGFGDNARVDYGDFISDTLGYQVGKYLHQNFLNIAIQCPQD